MNPQKEILDQFENIKMKFEKIHANSTSKNEKKNIKTLSGKEYELLQNQLMNFFTDLAMNQENLQLILKSKLDFKIWNLLTERIFKMIKLKIEATHLGKNYQVLIQNLYSTLLEDLRNNFQFFRNIYSIISNYEEKELNILISNTLNFMGDIKKLKLILNRKFSEFKEFINIEGDFKKDANDALRFFNYALNNYPYNTRIYSNIGYVYREFLNDHQNSAYWFIRALSCVDNELKKVKDNLEKDFHSIRKKFLKIDYIVGSNVSFLNYDLEYFPILFYRIMGILYINIDIDKLEILLNNFKLIIEKILINYFIVPENHKFLYEFNGFIEQITILTIFNFHYNLNNLSDYPKESDKIIFNSEENKTKKLLNINIYNHHLMKELKNVDTTEIKNSFKFSLEFLNNFIKSVCTSINEFNMNFTEKFLLIIFYWLSLNYDVFEFLIDEDTRRHLKFFNFVLQSDFELKRVSQNEIAFKGLIDRINNMILPIETTFFGFIPLNRFFVLNQKYGVMKVDDVREINLINKISLIHFLNSFNLCATNDEEIAVKFWKRNNIINVKETVVTEGTYQNELKEKLLTSTKNQIVMNVRKVKPLILLDACNIAMRHGDKTFSTKGIQIVMDYFTQNGHKVLSFLPEYLFRSREATQNYAKKKRVVPDDTNYLNKLYEKGLVVQTPPQDYDDSYCIQYAKQYNAFIVTNDMYRDYLENIQDNRKRETERMWVKEKIISFTFNKDEFIPNPDSAFFREFPIDDYSKKAGIYNALIQDDI